MSEDKDIFFWFVVAIVMILVIAFACTPCSAGPLADQASCRIYVSHGNATSIGSGTLVDKDTTHGVVLTCAHLFIEEGMPEFVNGANRVRVVFRDSSTYYGQVIRYNKQSDLAAIRIMAPRGKTPVRVNLETRKADVFTSNGFGPNGIYVTRSGRAVGEANATNLVSLVTQGGARSGDSGGGTFDRNDNLVGVIWGSDGGQTYSSFRTPLRNFLYRVFSGQPAPRIFVPGGNPRVVTRPQPQQPYCPTGTCPNVPTPAPPRPSQPYCPTGTCPNIPTPAPPRPRLDEAPPVRPQPEHSILTDPRWEEYAQRIDALEAKIDLVQRIPGPPGPPGPRGPAGESMTAQEVSALIAAAMNQHTPATGVTHYVLVADREASYWPRTGDLAVKAQEAYSQVRITPPPNFAVGDLPQLVAYKDGDPVGTFRGQRDVEDALAKLARGENPRPS